MRNNLYMVPIFKHKTRDTDFILVQRFTKNKHSGVFEPKFFLRKIDHIYCAGQIEPLMEVYSPHSRNLNNLTHRILKFYVRTQFLQNKIVKVPVLSAMFPTLNDTIIRKSIRNLGGMQEISNSRNFYFNKNNLP